MKTRTLLFSFLIFAWPCLLWADDVKEQVRTLINISDYIGNDYINAVSDNQIADEFEYEEMQEFSTNLLFIHEALVDKINDEAFKNLPKIIENLQISIENKVDYEEVKKLTDSIKAVLISLNLVETAPVIWPSITEGKNLYSLYCKNCHGEKGLGDGVLAAGMTPEPSNFSEAEHLSPFHIYNTIHLGIEGTSMVAMPHLSDEEKWNLAFFVQTLTLQNQTADKSFFHEASQKADLELIATLTNKELANVFSENSLEKMLALRFHQSGNVLVQAIGLTKDLLNQTIEKYIQGDIEGAKSTALQAYFEGFEPIERKIIATGASIVKNVEAEMLALRSALNKPDNLDEVMLRYQNIIDQLNAIDTEDEGANSFWFVFLATLSILIREGLEALLIIVAILSALRAMDAEQAKKYVHVGWLSAVLIGVVGYFFTARLIAMGAQSRELIEGLGALIAVVVLLSVGFWLHDKSNAARWNQYIKGKIQKHLSSGSNFAIGFLAFVVVFREAFESVIFLSALTVGGDTASKNGVLVGSMVSLIFILLLAVLIVRFSKKLPVHHVFKISSIAMIVLAIILAGKGMKELQEAGIFSVHLAPFNFSIEFLGIYPTWEGIWLQMLTLLISLVMIAYNKSKIKN